MDLTFAKTRFGEVIDFGPCILGKNLNLVTVRGFGRLDQLACISSPDVYDQVDNQTGTQRALKKKHALDCFAYASDATAMAPEEEPRAFPEIILNVRDSSPVEFYNLEDPSELYEISSFNDEAQVLAPIIGTRFRLSQLEFPKPTKSPQISRVDGNHRLYGADNYLDGMAAEGENETNDDDGTMPFVPFALFVDLKPIQEGSLFRDINAEHEGMETAHLTTLTHRLHTAEELKNDPKLLPLWIAVELSNPGHAFEGIVFRGGSTAGLKRAGIATLIRINTLKTAVSQQLRSAPFVTTNMQTTPDELLILLDHYWTAVKNTFVEAWIDRKNFILLQSIGLNGFAEFGGMILDRAVNDGSVSVSDFEQYLAPASKVSLRREDYPGVAGAGGARHIAEILIRATSPMAVGLERVFAQLRKERSVDSKLGIDVTQT